MILTATLSLSLFLSFPRLGSYQNRAFLGESWSGAVAVGERERAEMEEKWGSGKSIRYEAERGSCRGLKKGPWTVLA